MSRYALPLLAAVLPGAGIWYILFKNQRRDYPHEVHEHQVVLAGGQRVYLLLQGDGGETTVELLAYSREGSDDHAYHEQDKESHELTREALR